MLRQRFRFPTRVLMPFWSCMKGVVYLRRRCHGWKWTSACRHFFNNPTGGPTLGLAGLPLWQPLPQATRPAALSDAYQISPIQNFEKLLGDPFL